MNESNSSSMDVYNSVDDLLLIFACTPVSLFGLVASIVSLWVFIECKFKETVFEYLKIEMVIISVDLLIGTLTPIHACETCSVSKTIVARIVYQYFFIFASVTLERSCLTLKLFEAYETLKVLNDSRSKHPTVKPYIVTCISIGFFAFVTSYQLFAFSVTKMDAGVYSSKPTEFYSSHAYHILDLTSFTVTCGVSLVVLITIDVRIMLKMRANMSIKMKILNYKNDSIRKSRTKLTAMIMADCVNTIVNHFSNWLFYILSYSMAVDGLPLMGITTFIIYNSNSIKIFLYYNFNKRFRTVLNRLLFNLKDHILKLYKTEPVSF